MRSVVLVAGIAAAILSGCAVRTTGLVRPSDTGARLIESDGEEWRLVLLGPSVALGSLDGHTVWVSGQRFLGAIRVADWKVVDGLHGMHAMVGPLRRMGAQIGVEDRNSGAFYWLDDAAARKLEGHVDGIVLLEGYVDGPHRLHVMFFRVLTAPDG